MLRTRELVVKGRVKAPIHLPYGFDLGSNGEGLNHPSPPRQKAIQLLGGYRRGHRAAGRVEGEIALARRSEKRPPHGLKGFWIGWRPWRFSLLGMVRIRQTENA
jgi:hypothetical protein